MLKQLCIQAHSSSLRCGGSLCKFQHDNLYNASHCKSKKCAFTLAEVLITLVIIGIVAALTIPNLLQKYQEQATVKKVQKFYSNLSNAYALARKENGIITEWGLISPTTSESSAKVYEILFKPYFKISKDCGFNNAGNCIANVTYKRLNNDTAGYYATWSNLYKISLDDGSAIFFRLEYADKIGVYYDVNGVKGPNQLGIDLFSYYIMNDGAIPVGMQTGKYVMAPFNSGCADKNTAAGWGCTAWVIYKGNMDYLHCDGLTWKSSSCKDK